MLLVLRMSETSHVQALLWLCFLFHSMCVRARYNCSTWNSGIFSCISSTFCDHVANTLSRNYTRRTKKRTRVNKKKTNIFVLKKSRKRELNKQYFNKFHVCLLKDWAEAMTSLLLVAFFFSSHSLVFDVSSRPNKSPCTIPKQCNIRVQVMTAFMRTRDKTCLLFI